MSDNQHSELMQSQQDNRPSAFPKQAWVAMMLEPRNTMKGILASSTPRRGFWALLVLVTLSSIVVSASNGDMAGMEGAHLIGVAVGAVVAIPLAYLLMYISAWVTRLVARWFGGDGELDQVVTGFVWGQVPMVISLLLALTLFLLYGPELLYNPNAIADGGMVKSILALGIGVLQMIFNIWALVLGVGAMTVTLNLSIPRAIGVLLVSMLLMLLPVVAIGFLAAMYV